MEKLEAAICRALADPAVRDKLKAVAYAPDGRSGEEFRQLIDADIKAYADVVSTANLKFDEGAAGTAARAVEVCYGTAISKCKTSSLVPSLV